MSNFRERRKLVKLSLLCLLVIILCTVLAGCTPKQDSKKASQLYQASQDAHQRGNADEELALLRKAHSLDLNNSQYTLKLTNMLIDKGKFEETEKILTKALKIDAENVDLHLAFGENYITWAQQVKSISDQSALADKAVLEFKLILKKDPEHFDAMLYLANTFAHYPNMNDFHAQAEKYFQRLLTMQENIPSEKKALVYYYYGQFLQTKGRADEAHAIWAEGAKLYPENTLLKEKL